MRAVGLAALLLAALWSGAAVSQLVWTANTLNPEASE